MVSRSQQAVRSNGLDLSGAGVFVPVLLVVAALGLWIAALPGYDLARMTDLGLISIMPREGFVALGVLVVSFCLALAQAPRRWLLALHVIALIFMLYGITALVEPLPRFSVSWLHAGLTQQIMDQGALDRLLDSRSNWPGLFVVSALLAQVGGLPTILPLLNWAPLAFSLLYLGPLVLIYEAVTNDQRLVWLGVWLFFAANMVGQDYYAPQALAFFLYLVVIAVLLRWFKAAASPAEGLPRPLTAIYRCTLGMLGGPERANAPATPGQQTGLVVVVAVLSLAITASHPLTPFFLLVAIGLLVFFNRITLHGLPILVGVILVSWTVYMASTLLAGNLAIVTGDFGQIGAIVNSSITDRLSGSVGHLLVVYVRVAMTLGIWGMALLGGLRRLITGSRDTSLALLAAAPFSLLVLQNYGGEMPLRVYLFALPAMAFFVAALLFPRISAGRSVVIPLLVALLSVVVLGGFLVARYGNERMDYYTPDEAAAVDALYDRAEPGALLVASSFNTPWKHRDQGRFRTMTLTDEFLAGDADAIVREVAAAAARREVPATYLILTRSQAAYLSLFFELDQADWEALLDALAASPRFEVLDRTPDALILKLVQTGE